MPGEMPTAEQSRKRQDRNGKSYDTDDSEYSDVDSTDSEKTILNQEDWRKRLEEEEEEIKPEPMSEDENQNGCTFKSPKPLSENLLSPLPHAFLEDNRKRHPNETQNIEGGAKKKRSELIVAPSHLSAHSSNTDDLRTVLNGRQQVREKRRSGEEKQARPSENQHHNSPSKQHSTSATLQEPRPINNKSKTQQTSVNRLQQPIISSTLHVNASPNVTLRGNPSNILTQRSITSSSNGSQHTSETSNTTKFPHSPHKILQHTGLKVNRTQQVISNPKSVVQQPSTVSRNTPKAPSSIKTPPPRLMLIAQQTNPPITTSQSVAAPRNTVLTNPTATSSTRSRFQPLVEPSTSHEATQTEDHIEEHQMQHVNVDKTWRTTHTTREQQHRFVLQNHLFSDITFLLGPQRTPIHCHKLPLVTASQIFEEIIYGNTEERQPALPLHLPDIEPQIFNLILQFLYTNSVDISGFNEACSLMQAAEKFELLELMDKCRMYLWLHIKRETMWTTLDFCCLTKDKLLIMSVLGVVKLDAENLLHSAEFERTSTRTVVNTLLSTNLQGQLNVNSEATLLDACIRWCNAEVQVRAGESTPPSLQDIFSPMRDKFHFLKFTPEEFTKSVIHTQILPTDEALAILSELIVPNSSSIVHPLPQYVIRTNPAPIVNNKPLQIYGIKRSNVTSTGGLIDGSLQSVHDLISTMKLKVNSGDVLYGVKLTTQILNLAGAYDEKLTVFVNDVESGENVFSVTVKTRLASSSEFEVGFDAGIVFAELPKFATRKVSEVEIKVVPHKSGKYSFINNRSKMCTGQFKDKNDCRLRHPPRHNFIICAALNAISG